MPDIRYIIEVDTQHTGTFAHGLDDISNDVIQASSSCGMWSWQDRISPGAWSQFRVLNIDGKYHQDDSTADYYGLLKRGTQIRLSIYYNGVTTVLSTLIIQTVIPNVGRYNNNPVIEIRASDTTQQLQQLEYLPPLQTDVRSDTALKKVFEANLLGLGYLDDYVVIDASTIGSADLIYTDDGSQYDMETGYATLPYIGDPVDDNATLNAIQYIQDIVSAEVFGRWFFQARNGKWTFHNRYHDSLETSQYTVDDKLIENAAVDYQGFLINDMSVQVFPRAVGAVGSVLFSSDNVPFQLAAGTTRTFRVNYTDPNNDNASVGALDVISPVIGIDVIGNQNQDGSGDDWTSLIGASISTGAGSSAVSLSARKTGDPIWITTFQVRGTPLTAYEPETLHAVNAQSLNDYGRYVGSEAFAGITDTGLGERIAQYIVNSLAEPAVTFERIVVPVTEDSIEMVETLTIGDAITVTDSGTTHNRDYIIVGEQHNPAVNQTPRVTYTLKAKDHAQAFVINTSSINGTDIIGI